MQFENLSFAYIHYSRYFVLIPLTKIKGYKVESDVRVSLSDWFELKLSGHCFLVCKRR